MTLALPEKTLFVSDFFRTDVNQAFTQEVTARNSRHYMGELLQRSLGAETAAFDTSIFGDYAPFARTCFGFFGLESSAESWAKIYNREAPLGLVDFLGGYFKKGTFVFSSEAPPVLQSALNQLDIPFVDVRCSWLRCLDNLITCFASNNDQIMRRLAAFDIFRRWPELVAAGIGRVKEATAATEKYPGRALIYLGQVAEDSAVIVGERGFLTGEDVVGGLDKIMAQNPGATLFAKPHPCHLDTPVMQALADRGIPLLTDNLYELYARFERGLFVAYSSSSCYEAALFGKEIAFIQEKRQIDGYVSVLEEQYTTEFWQFLFAPEPCVLPAKTRLAHAPNLREILNVNWDAWSGVKERLGHQAHHEPEFQADNVLSCDR